ncbi:hypothetical protein [Microvirga zambiensis]|uniref:hypothetical protein n=1 Tax=Microvirga zambiensis TaxID=1402137 RepID=UPI00191DE1C1|nr:hypothetical protein [Microvirga zambiensis]
MGEEGPSRAAQPLPAVDPAVVAGLEAEVAIQAAAIVVVEIVRTPCPAQREQIVGSAGPGAGLVLILGARARPVLGPGLVAAIVIPGAAHIGIAAASSAAAAVVGPVIVTASTAALASVIIPSAAAATAIVVASATAPAAAVVTGTAASVVIATASAAAAAIVSAAPSPIAAAIVATAGHGR